MVTKPRFIFVQFLSLLLSVSCQGQSNISYLEKRLLGVWPMTTNVSHTVTRDFSWGTGKFIENDSFVIDYEINNAGKKIFFENPGIGRFFIVEIKQVSENIFLLKLEKSQSVKVSTIPDQGVLRITFKTINEIVIDDVGYPNFGAPPNTFILRRLSP